MERKNVDLDIIGCTEEEWNEYIQELKTFADECKNIKPSERFTRDYLSYLIRHSNKLMQLTEQERINLEIADCTSMFYYTQLCVLHRVKFKALWYSHTNLL